MPHTSNSLPISICADDEEVTVQNMVLLSLLPDTSYSTGWWKVLSPVDSDADGVQLIRYMIPAQLGIGNLFF